MSKNNKPPIVKRVIHAGQKYIPIADGSKVHFHFQTWKVGKERILVDDSKKIGTKEPMVLVLGHKFKLEVWETIVRMMAVGEVSSFVVDQEHVFCYPYVSKTLRELGQPVHKVKHVCTMTLHTEGIGYKDLDELMRDPCDLEFIIELLKVERKDEFEKDIWQLDGQEKLDMIPQLREKGNKLYAQKNYAEAEEVYEKALTICEQLMLRERKIDEEWKSLNKLKLPVLLNYAQCKLIGGDFYKVIEYCTNVLEYDKDNEKALYRRAKAYLAVWSPDHAERDLNQLKALNPTMAATVDKELENITQLRKEKAELDKNAMKNMFNTQKSKAGDTASVTV